MKKRIGLLLLILLLCFSVSHAEELTAVRVGEHVYPQSLLQFTLNVALDLNDLNAIPIQEEDLDQLKEDACMKYVDIGILEEKLTALGQNEFTEEEQGSLELYAEQAYETLWQGLYRQLSSEDSAVTEEQVTEWLEEQDYTILNFLLDGMASVRVEKALNLFCCDVTINSKEVSDYYLQTYVTPDRERYEQNVPLYEQEMLLTGSEAFFIPKGYYYIRCIRLALPPEVIQCMEAAGQQVEAVEQTRKQAYNALAEAAAGGEDIAPYKATYDETVAAKAKAEAARQAEMEKALPLLQKKTDAIRSEYLNGKAFEALATEYSADANENGSVSDLLFHPNSTRWDEEFRLAAAALEKPGDLSLPVLTEAGVYLICRGDDVPGGIRVLNDKEQEALNAAALRSRKLEQLDSMLLEWRKEFQWEIHPEMLSVE